MCEAEWPSQSSVQTFENTKSPFFLPPPHPSMFQPITEEITSEVMADTKTKHSEHAKFTSSLVIASE